MAKWNFFVQYNINWGMVTSLDVSFESNTMFLWAPMVWNLLISSSSLSPTSALAPSSTKACPSCLPMAVPVPVDLLRAQRKCCIYLPSLIITMLLKRYLSVYIVNMFFNISISGHEE